MIKVENVSFFPGNRVTGEVLVYGKELEKHHCEWTVFPSKVADISKEISMVELNILGDFIKEDHLPRFVYNSKTETKKEFLTRVIGEYVKLAAYGPFYKKLKAEGCKVADKEPMCIQCAGFHCGFTSARQTLYLNIMYILKRCPIAVIGEKLKITSEKLAELCLDSGRVFEIYGKSRELVIEEIKMSNRRSTTRGDK